MQTTLLTIILFVLVIGAFLVFPAVAMIDCAVAPISRGRKLSWLVAMIIGWGPVGWLWGIKNGSSQKIVRAGWVSLIGSVMLLLSYASILDETEKMNRQLNRLVSASSSLSASNKIYKTLEHQHPARMSATKYRVEETHTKMTAWGKSTTPLEEIEQKLGIKGRGASDSGGNSAAEPNIRKKTDAMRQQISQIELRLPQMKARIDQLYEKMTEVRTQNPEHPDADRYLAGLKLTQEILANLENVKVILAESLRYIEDCAGGAQISCNLAKNSEASVLELLSNQDRLRERLKVLNLPSLSSY